MNKSRFENLETERPAVEREPKAALERFAASESPRTVVEGGNVEDPDHIPKPSGATERFAASGDEGVALQLKDDSEQPFRRCPSCRRDSTRYEKVCKFCGTALDSPEAQAFNEELWKRLKAEQQVEKAQLEAAHAKAHQVSQEQSQRLAAAQREMIKELDAHYSGGVPTGGISWQWRLALLVTGILMMASAWHFALTPIVRLFLGGAGMVVAAFAVPARFWLYGARSKGYRGF